MASIHKEIVPTENEKINVFMRKPETMERFEEILGRGYRTFVASALIIINSDKELQACTTMSLYKSTLRAASLELSLDQSLRQGWIIPRSKNVGTKDNPNYVQEASFQPHYNGLRALAERTGKYRYINVSPVYEGQTVWLDQLTGIHNVALESGLLTDHEPANRLRSERLAVTGGAPDKKVIGYIGYYETHRGTKKTVWMTIKEIHEHAKKWAGDAYTSKYGAWQDPKKRPVMEMKTVFIQLTKTMDLSGKENDKLRSVLSEEIVESEMEQEYVDAVETVEPTTIPATVETASASMPRMDLTA